MDPQATLARILELWLSNDSNSHDEYAIALRDLFNWIRKGGFRPIPIQGMPKRMGTNSNHDAILNLWTYAIQIIDPNNPSSGYEIVRYHPNGVQFTSYPLQ